MPEASRNLNAKFYKCFFFNADLLFFFFKPFISYYSSPCDSKWRGIYKSIFYIILSCYERGRYKIHKDIERNACYEYNN